MEILKNIQNDYPELKIIKNECNKGLAFTRNKGLDNATGRYIWFVDPDDMLVPETIKTMLDLAVANDADILGGNYIRFNDGEIPCQTHLPEKIICQESVEPSLDPNGIKMCSAWHSLYKRSFLLRYHLRFNDHLRMQEDTFFWWDVSRCKPRRFKCNLYCYHYRQRSTSLLHSRSLKNQIQYYESMFYMLHDYMEQRSIISDEFRSALEDKILHSYHNVAMTLAYIPETRYVKKQFSVLKREKLYPYKRRKWENKLSRFYLIAMLLPIEPFFWFIHYSYKFYLKIRKL